MTRNYDVEVMSIGLSSLDRSCFDECRVNMNDQLTGHQSLSCFRFVVVVKK